MAARRRAQGVKTCGRSLAGCRNAGAASSAPSSALWWVTVFVSDTKAGITFSTSDYEELSAYVDQYQTWFAGGAQHHAGCTQIRFGRVVINYLAALGLGAEKATEKRVPESVFSAPREAVVGFLQGLFTADGTVNLSCGKKSCSVRLASSSRGLLKDVQLLLSNFGLASRIYHRRAAGVRPMPDGKGGTALYAHASQYELILDKINRDLFVEKIGFLTRSKQQRGSSLSPPSSDLLAKSSTKQK